MLTLNIGLNVSASQVEGMAKLPFAGAGTLDVGSVEKALDIMFGAGSYEYKLTSSNTEPTLVVRLHGYECVPVERVFTLSLILGQDCIAAQVHTDTVTAGVLVGPNAAEWGEFDSRYFIEY